MNAKLVVIFLFLGAFSSCERTSTSERKHGESQPASPAGTVALPEPAARQAEAFDIYEVTFRYLFQKNASGQQQKAGAYFLRIGDGSKVADPDDAFMKRFADVKPPVKRGSESEISEEKGVIDKSTGVTGLLGSGPWRRRRCASFLEAKQAGTEVRSHATSANAQPGNSRPGGRRSCAVGEGR